VESFQFIRTDTEDFLIITGELEGLIQDGDNYKWIGAKPGDYMHVPSNAHHAWRNLSVSPTVVLIITTKKLGRFFQEIGISRHIVFNSK
jgi:quercetin dioxygenase-like cupin family protein